MVPERIFSMMASISSRNFAANSRLMGDWRVTDSSILYAWICIGSTSTPCSTYRFAKMTSSPEARIPARRNIRTIDVKTMDAMVGISCSSTD